MSWFKKFTLEAKDVNDQINNGKPTATHIPDTDDMIADKHKEKKKEDPIKDTTLIVYSQMAFLINSSYSSGCRDVIEQDIADAVSLAFMKGLIQPREDGVYELELVFVEKDYPSGTYPEKYKDHKLAVDLYDRQEKCIYLAEFEANYRLCNPVNYVTGFLNDSDVISNGIARDFGGSHPIHAIKFIIIKHDDYQAKHLERLEKLKEEARPDYDKVCDKQYQSAKSKILEAIFALSGFNLISEAGTILSTVELYRIEDLGRLEDEVSAILKDGFIQRHGDIEQDNGKYFVKIIYSAS